jgi:tetratricopeptide (TPR) repeat protein
MKKSAIVLFFSALASLGALAQNVQQGINDLYAERYQSAKSTFEKLLATNPNNIEANYWLGQVYIDMNDISGARALYDKALASSNNAPLILVGVGQMELMQGKTAEARQRFESAINASKGRKGNDPNILNAVGHAIVESYSEKNKTDVDYAIAKLNEAAQLAPTNPDIYLNLGNAYRKKHDGGNAVQAYNKAGNFAPALYQIGRIYETQKSLRNPSEWDIVLENFNKAIAADPRFVPAYNELYIYYLWAKHDFPTAETFANKIVSNSDPSVENEYLVAQTDFVQNKYTDAINIGKKILAQATNPNPRVYRLLTFSYMGNKDTVTACQYANQYFEKQTNEDKIEASDYLMHAQACGKNNPDIILADIDKAVQKDPENSVRVLKEALDDAKKSQQRLLEGELGLILYKLQGTNAKPAQLVSLGTPFYYGGDFKKADSLFSAYSKAFPDSIFGYLWSAKALFQMDTAMTQGLAVPAYENILKIAETDKTRDLYKSNGVYAAGFLAGYYNNIKQDKNTALSYIDRGLAIDPANQTLLTYKKALSARQQQPTQQQKTSTSNNSAKTDTKTKTPVTKTKVKKG